MPKGIKFCGKILIVPRIKHMRLRGGWDGPCADKDLPSIAGVPASAIRCRQRVRNYAGAIIFGGPMSVNGEDAWLRREIDWIWIPLKEDTPFQVYAL